MTPDQAKKINDLRMKILQAHKEGREVREVVSVAELQEAISLLREARRLPTTDKPKKAAAQKVSTEELFKELGL